MKKIITLAGMAFLSSMPFFGLDAAEVRLARIETEQLVTLEKKVTTDLAQDAFRKRLVFTAALMAGGYLGYKYFYPAANASSIPASAEQVNDNNILLHETTIYLQQLLKNQNQLELQNAGSSSWLKESMLGKFGSWVWEVGKWSTQQAVIAYMANVLLFGSSSALGRVVKTIDSAVDSVSFSLFHERDLKWFLISRARITNLFNELESHAFALQTGTTPAVVDISEQEKTIEQKPADAHVAESGLAIDDVSYAYHVSAFEQTWQQLVDRTASLVAFIEYKARSTEDAIVQERLLLGIKHIIELTNNTAQQCEQLISGARLDALPVHLLFEVRRMRSMLSDELLLANKLEHEVSW